MHEAVRIAAQLADEFRLTAAELDRSEEFPRANYARMREAGYLRAAVPEELGGLGAGLADLARAQQALALAILCKEAVTGHAGAVVEKAMQIAGGRSYFKRSPLERLGRDMRVARYHPLAAPVSFQMVGERLREQVPTD